MHCTTRRVLPTAFFCCFPPSCWPGNWKRPLKRLQIHNYFLARDLFFDQVKKHPAAAWYGLSVIHGRDDNPFYHLDSAYVYIQRCDAAFTHTDASERNAIKPLGVDDDAIRAQLKHLHQLAWDEASKQNTVAAYDRYVNTYLQSERAEDARKARDHLAFEAAHEQNTSAAYQDFIDRYPNAAQIYQARSRLQEAVYRESTSDGTVQAFERFIQEHPDSPYLKNAEDEIYRLLTAPRTPEAYHGFITAYPLNHRVPDAWRSLYELYTKDLNVANITRFLKDYPDYPFIQELSADYSTAALVLHPFRRDSLWGFIDDDGIERIKAEYEWVEEFHGGQTLVGRNGRTGSINKAGHEVVHVDYDDVPGVQRGVGDGGTCRPRGRGGPAGGARRADGVRRGR
jgi:hypothetical protein